MSEKISDAELIKLFNKNKLFDLFNMTVLEVDTQLAISKLSLILIKNIAILQVTSKEVLLVEW